MPLTVSASGLMYDVWCMPTYCEVFCQTEEEKGRANWRKQTLASCSIIPIPKRTVDSWQTDITRLKYVCGRLLFSFLHSLPTPKLLIYLPFVMWFCNASQLIRYYVFLPCWFWSWSCRMYTVWFLMFYHLP